MRLPFVPPLDWGAMLGYFRARAILGVEQVAGGVYRRTVVVDGDPAVLELSLGGEDHLLLRPHLPPRARRIFNLDADIAAANLHLQADPIVGPLVRERPGLRAPGTWDAFETGVRAIVGQQVSVAGAGTIIARIVARHGAPVPGLHREGLTRVFPTPSRLAAADLDGAGLTTARAGAIRAFARAVAGGAVTLDGSAGLEDLVASIVALPGLGEWTAHYLALRLGAPDAFPATDLGIRRALEGASGARLTRRDIEATAAGWRPWRAHAATHLWLAGSTPRPVRSAV